MTAPRFILCVMVFFGTACGNDDTKPEPGAEETAAAPRDEMPNPNSLESCQTVEFVLPAGALQMCDYHIPEVQTDRVNYGQINLVHTPSTGMPQIVPKVSNPTGCGRTDGWYYDVPGDPTKIILCPPTCATIEADSGAEITIVLGCATVVR